MYWIYDGLGGGHNGEYYWSCSECGRTEWWASYDDPNKLGIQCGKCDEVKAERQEIEDIKLAELELKEQKEYLRLAEKFGRVSD